MRSSFPSAVLRRLLQRIYGDVDLGFWVFLGGGCLWFGLFDRLRNVSREHLRPKLWPDYEIPKRNQGDRNQHPLDDSPADTRHVPIMTQVT